MTTRERQTVWRVAKILLWVAGFYVVWQVLSSDKIGNTILAFLLDGAVPGTKTVLPPDAVLWTTVALFCTGVLGLVIWAIVHFRRTRKTEPLALGLVAADVVLAETVSRPSAKTSKVAKPSKSKAKTPAKPGKQKKAASSKQAVPGVPSWRLRLMVFAKRVHTKLRPVAASTKRVSLRLGYRAAIYVLGGYELLRIGGGKLVVKIRTGSIAFWRQAEPRLLAFDTFLGTLILQAEAWIRQFVRQHQDLTFIREQLREARKILGTYSPDKLKQQTLGMVYKIKRSVFGDTKKD